MSDESGCAMTPNYFPTRELTGLRDSLQTVIDALDADAYQAARDVTAAVLEMIQERVKEIEDPGPNYATKRQLYYLASLTGKASHPFTYWSEMQLLKPEASDAIGNLLLLGEAEIRGRTYYRITTDQQEKNAALRKKLGTTKCRKRKAA